ncbi:helix-turn-helix domain-containing protein [Streptomyces sp. NPDC001514]
MLAALGLGAAEEEIYRHLIVRASGSAGELADDLGRSPAEVHRLLTALAGLGLVTAHPADAADRMNPTDLSQTGDCETVFTAAPPTVALGPVLRERRDALRAAELDLLNLAEQHRLAAHDRASDVVEVITDIETVRHRFAQLQNSARREVRSMMVPHLAVVPHRQNEAAFAGLRRGIHYRAMVPRELLTLPGMVGEVLDALTRGEEVRVTESVPVKLVIADSDLAMVPLSADRNTAAASIVVHPSGLLDVLMAYFEAAWERAYPLSPSAAGDGVTETPTGDIDELDVRILTLMLSGLTDQTAAGQLGISRRTYQRRIGDLMAKAGVDTRVQLGWHAARRGWA